MSDKKLIKIYPDKECIFIKTISKSYKSPNRFILLRSNLEELKKKKELICNDINSFLIARLEKNIEGMDILYLKFVWLNEDGYKNVSGKIEELRVPYQKFQACIDGTEEGKLLSISKKWTPKIEFRGENLREIVKSKRLRRNLGKILMNFFNWTNTKKIILVDDFPPKSFFFKEETIYGKGICGVIILNNRNLETAYYSIHT